MNIILNDATELAVAGVHSQQVTYQGILRDCLIFLLEPGVISVDEACKLFSEENCKTVKIVDKDSEHIHSNYTIQLEAGVGLRDIALFGTMMGSETAGTTDNKKVYVKMAQSTIAERQLQQQQDVIDAMLISQLNG